MNLPPFKWPLNAREWEQVYRKITAALALVWEQVDKTGSNLTDLATRNHSDLQNINTASYTHLTAANHTDLTDGGATSIHKHDHAAQDNLNSTTYTHLTAANHTDLTDGGNSALHHHDTDRDRANHTGTQTRSTISDFAHDHTTADSTGPLTNDEHDGFVEIAISSTPSTPASGKMRIYAQDAAGVARLRAIHSTGNDLAFFRDSVARAKNTSGGTINKGEVVYITGATGNFPTIAKAKADSGTTMPVAGMVTVTAANNAFTTIQILGEITGLDTSGFIEGAIVFVSPSTAGALTATEPGHPYLSQPIGIVTKSNAGAGSIQLFISAHHEGDPFGTNRNTFSVGDAAAGAKTLAFTNANVGSLQWNPTGTRTLTLPDKTGTVLIGATGSGTLTAGTTSTITNATATTTSVITLQSTSAAFAPLGAYISAKNNGSFVITHTIAAGTETFDFVILP